MGILEIKSSAYPHAIENLIERTDPAFALPLVANIDDTNGREGELLGYVSSGGCFAMGVVSVLQKDQLGIEKLRTLRNDGKVVVLFEEKDDTFESQKDDVYRLVNFLGLLRLRAALRDGRVGINNILLKPDRLI